MSRFWDFFIAHSKEDKEVAEQFYTYLKRNASVFLDSQCISPGDQWDKVLLEAECRSRIIILLISKNLDGSYYFRDEISRAIRLSRISNCLVVPVYLDKNCEVAPYGLTNIQGLFLYESSIEKVVAELIFSLAKIKQEGDLLQISPTWFSQIPSQPAYFVGRDKESYEIKEKFGLNTSLKETNFQAISAMQGMPGVGKTAFVSSLANDYEIHKLFPDGILWCALGQTPNLLSKFCAWGEVLMNQDLLSTGGLKQLVSVLKQEFHNKRMLIILDDVWNHEHVTPIRQSIGKHCSVIVTTRQPLVLARLEIPKSNICTLPTLEEKHAVLLMELLAGEVMEQHRKRCLKLLKKLDFLPLAIHIAANLLREEHRMGWGIDELIKSLTVGDGLLNATLPINVIDEDRNMSTTLRGLLEQSTKHLNADLRVRFSQLAVFEPKPFAFNSEALQAIWETQDPKPFIRELVNRGLLEPVGRNRFQIHSILSLHAKSLIN